MDPKTKSFTWRGLVFTRRMEYGHPHWHCTINAVGAVRFSVWELQCAPNECLDCRWQAEFSAKGVWTDDWIARGKEPKLALNKLPRTVALRVRNLRREYELAEAANRLVPGWIVK